jgi:hypothetical protein
MIPGIARFEAALAEAETIADCDRAWNDLIEPLLAEGRLTRAEQDEAQARLAERCAPLMEESRFNE